MSGYEKVSFLKFDAAGLSWYVTGWHVSETPGHSWVDVRMEDDVCNCGRVDMDSGSLTEGGHMMLVSQLHAIVEYLRANPLPGDGE